MKLDNKVVNTPIFFSRIYLTVLRESDMALFRHPSQVCMTYAEHCCFSLGLAWSFACACVAAVIHAFIPDVLVTYSSDTVSELRARMRGAGCR